MCARCLTVAAPGRRSDSVTHGNDPHRPLHHVCNDTWCRTCRRPSWWLLCATPNTWNAGYFVLKTNKQKIPPPTTTNQPIVRKQSGNNALSPSAPWRASVFLFSSYVGLCFARCPGRNRHETPVLDHSIKIIYVDNDLVVLDKPCSLPVSKVVWPNHPDPDVRRVFIYPSPVYPPPPPPSPTPPYHCECCPDLKSHVFCRAVLPHKYYKQYGDSNRATEQTTGRCWILYPPL